MKRIFITFDFARIKIKIATATSDNCIQFERSKKSIHPHPIIIKSLAALNG